MRNFIWSLVKRFFSNELRDLIAITQGEVERLVKVQVEQRQNYRMTLNYPIGTKVFIRSNEPEAIIIAEVKGYKSIGGQLFLRCQNIDTGVEHFAFGESPAYYSEELASALEKLNWAEQWNVLASRAPYTISEAERLRKESPEYLNRNKEV